MDTRSSVGWDAPHFSEVCRQWVSFGLQRENARLLINGASRRQSRARDNQFRDMALHGDGIADDEDVADPRLLLRNHIAGVVFFPCTLPSARLLLLSPLLRPPT